MYGLLLKVNTYPSISFHNTSVDLEIVRENVINNTKEILNGVDLNIKWLDADRVERLEYKYGLDAHRHILEEAIIGPVFDIPVVASKIFSSYLEFYNERSDNFKDRVYKHIAISDEFPEIVEGDYFHELSHVLLDRNWYTVINPLLKEYIPHCLEMYYDFFLLNDPDKFIKRFVLRMLRRKHKYMPLTKSDNELSVITEEELTYSIAFFLSCITFEKYYDFTLQAKQEMEKDLKAILNGKCLLNDFLGKYDINLHTDESINFFEKTIDRVKSYTP